MGYLSVPDPVSEQTARLYSQESDRVGYVPNYTKAFAGRPDVYSAWMQLNAAIRANMPARVYELATVAAAKRLGSSYCCLAHGKILAEKHLDARVVEDLVRDPVGADLSDVDRAILVLADSIASDPSEIAPADLQPLRDLGFTDEEVFDVILATSARCFFSTVLEATGAEPDVAYETLEPALREALTVGRPIAAS